MDSEICKRISETAATWLCNSYSIDTRFLSEITADGTHRLLSALIFLDPIAHKTDNNFQQIAGNLYVGQIITPNVTKEKSLQIIQAAIAGEIYVYGKKLALENEPLLEFHSESLRRDLWFYPLHLRISGRKASSHTYIDSFNTDNALRNAQIPFDGVADLAGWLGISEPVVGQDAPSITLRVNPPADLALADCRLAAEKLELKILALSKFEKTEIGVSVREVPGKGLAARYQVGNVFKWRRVKDGIRVGTASIPMQFADQVLVVLSLGGVVVRRNWFVNPARARNQRLIAVQQFDQDLRMIKREILTPSTTDKFELSVAALLYLMGFNPVVQIETDSPDIVLFTPEGRLAVIECTTRIADNALKIGKLVDRRGALTKTLSANDHPAKVLGILICALPKDQMAISDDELLRNKIILVCKEDISAALNQLRFPKNPDQLFIDAENKLINPKIFSF